MIVVGIGKALHDSGIAAYIDGKIKYCKYEREQNIKHGKAPEKWYWKKLAQWGVNLMDINLIYETDAGHFKKYNLPRLPHGGAEKWKISDEHYLVDHHQAHLNAHTKWKKGSNGVVIDGLGSGNHTTMSVFDNKIERSMDWIGKDYSTIAHYYVQKDFKIKKRVEGGLSIIEPSNSLDDNGKFMSLVPFHKDLIEWNNNMFERVKSHFKKKGKVYYMGGCALNLDWNRKLFDQGYEIDVEPHVYDGGLALGCLKWALNDLDIEIKIDNFPYIQDDESPKNSATSETIEKVSELLSKGKIVGWYQGNGEVGPRALGNRSILMDPSIKNGKDFLNKRVKKRENWRPYGATILQEENHKYFDFDAGPYMLFTSKCLFKDIDSIIHVDNTCRQQTLKYEQNKLYYDLINSFYKKTGLPMVLNTSLNIGGFPIASSISAAMKAFKNSEMDAICIGNDLYQK